MDVRLTDIISPHFFQVHADICRNGHAKYWLKGGRGSTKSSFIAIEIIYQMLKNPEANALVLRKVGRTLRESVYNQYKWAIDMLGMAEHWTSTIVPLQHTYKPTGQRILFTSSDDPAKMKSLQGDWRYIHYEEVTEFDGPEELRSLNQTILRGEDVQTFYSYNPPRSKANWTNVHVAEEESDSHALVHMSDYRTVPKGWLGERWIADAEELKRKNPKAYAHEYLGEVFGTDADVFQNVCTIKIKSLSEYEAIYCGVDFGYTVDPTAFILASYNSKRDEITFLGEIYSPGLSSKRLGEEILSLFKRTGGINPKYQVITADSAEPRTISDLREFGLQVIKAKKGPDSVNHGIGWLQSRTALNFDPDRTPNAYREFANYEYQRGHDGIIIPKFPDKNNHSIDATRYAFELESRSKPWITG